MRYRRSSSAAQAPLPIDEPASSEPARAWWDVEPRERARHNRMTDLEAAVASAKARAKSGEWHGAGGSVMIGLYAMLHHRAYGVDAAELQSAAEMKRASAAAGRVLRDQFGGDPDAMAEFVVWAWRRETKRMEWAKSQGRDRSRLAWRFMFSAAFVTDYRVDRRGVK